MKANTELSASRRDGLAARPDLRWCAFEYGMLVLLYELREKARKVATRGASMPSSGPEDTADELIDEIAAVGAEADVAPELVGMAVDAGQRALYRHITVPGRWGSWAALQSAAQEAAEEVAGTVAAVADDMVETREQYKRTTTDEDAVETIISMNRLIGMMRVAVAAVHASGPISRS